MLKGLHDGIYQSSETILMKISSSLEKKLNYEFICELIKTKQKKRKNFLEKVAPTKEVDGKTASNKVKKFKR